MPGSTPWCGGDTEGEAYDRSPQGTALAPVSIHPWAFLGVAILLEVAGTTFLKQSRGFEHLGYVAGVFVCYALSLIALGLAVKRIEIGVAYAVWAGLGTALIALIGVMVFREVVPPPLKLASLALIVLGVMGLHLEASP